MLSSSGTLTDLLARRHRVVSGGRVRLVIREFFPLTRAEVARLERQTKGDK